MLPNEYIGPTHACAGPNCKGKEHENVETEQDPKAEETGSEQGRKEESETEQAVKP